MIVIATVQEIKVPLDSAINLPLSFEYKPYIPKKRIVIKEAAKAVYAQKSVPLFLVGNQYIQWNMKGLTRSDTQVIIDLYNSIYNLTFTGYWGEDYEVEFSTLNSPSVKAGFFDFSGTFRIICVTTDFAPVCIAAQE